MAKHVIIMLDTSSDGFAGSEGAEISRILGLLAHEFRTGRDMAGEKIHDINGNQCGEVKVLIIEGGA